MKKNTLLFFTLFVLLNIGSAFMARQAKAALNEPPFFFSVSDGVESGDYETIGFSVRGGLISGTTCDIDLYTKGHIQEPETLVQNDVTVTEIVPIDGGPQWSLSDYSITGWQQTQAGQSDPVCDSPDAINFEYSGTFKIPGLNNLKSHILPGDPNAKKYKIFFQANNGAMIGADDKIVTVNGTMPAATCAITATVKKDGAIAPGSFNACGKVGAYNFSGGGTQTLTTGAPIGTYSVNEPQTCSPVTYQNEGYQIQNYSPTSDTCNGTGGETLNFNYNYTKISSNVDIRANGLNGPIQITAGSDITLSGTFNTTAYPSQCQAQLQQAPAGWSGTWSGNKDSGFSDVKNNLIEGVYVFALNCPRNTDISDSDSVQVTAVAGATPTPTPSGPTPPPPPSDERSITVSASSCPAGASWTVNKGGSQPRTFSGSGTYAQYDEGDGVINGNYTMSASALGGYTINSITPASTQTINSGAEPTPIYSITFNINCGAIVPAGYTIVVNSNIPTSWNAKTSDAAGNITADYVYSGVSQTNAVYENVTMPASPTPTPPLPTPPPPTTRSLIVDARTCPAGASWTITKSGGDPSFNGSGTTGIFQGGGSVIPNGNYTISPISINGGYSYTVTPAVTQTISSGAGNYSRTFTITCSVPASAFDGSYTIMDITSVSGYDAPTVSPATTQTLSSGQTVITFNINYNVTAGCYNVDNYNTWPDCAQFISQTIPATMTAGQSSPAVMTFKNTGASTWNFYPYLLGTLYNDTTWGVNGIVISAPAPAPGDSKTFNFNITAPNWPPNTYAFNRRSMLKVSDYFFGEASPDTNIQITAPTPLPPTASGVTVTSPNYCVSGPAATVGWTYSDPMGSPQTAYRVQIDNNASFVSPEVEVDSTKTTSTSTAYFSGTGILQFNTNYYARVMVWNSSDTPSSWSGTVSFSTPNYAYPQVDFSFSPTNPPISEPVQFTDATTFYAPGPTTWSWLFGDAGSSVLQNPTHTYTTEGSYGATLTATDNAGQVCSLTKTVNIQKAIPVWKEVAPR